jgi:hypothetical protein
MNTESVAAFWSQQRSARALSGALPRVSGVAMAIRLILF